MKRSSAILPKRFIAYELNPNVTVQIAKPLQKHTISLRALDLARTDNNPTVE